MTRRWRFDSPEYIRISCDEPGCSEDLILPTTQMSIAVRFALESGWTSDLVESGDYPHEEDRCHSHSP